MTVKDIINGVMVVGGIALTATVFYWIGQEKGANEEADRIEAEQKKFRDAESARDSAYLVEYMELDKARLYGQISDDEFYKKYYELRKKY